MPDSPSERAAKARKKPTLESEPDDSLERGVVSLGTAVAAGYGASRTSHLWSRGPKPDDAALCVIDAKTDKMIAQLLTGTKALDAYYQCCDEQGFAKTTPWHEAVKQSQSFSR